MIKSVKNYLLKRKVKKILKDKTYRTRSLRILAQAVGMQRGDLRLLLSKDSSFKKVTMKNNVEGYRLK
jgi:hypothetical protein